MRASRSHTPPAMEQGVLATGPARAHSGPVLNRTGKPVGSLAKCIEWIVDRIRSHPDLIENDADSIGSVSNSIEFVTVSTGFGTKPVGSIASLIKTASISIRSIFHWIQCALMFMLSDAARIHSTSVPVGSAAFPGSRRTILRPSGLAPAISQLITPRARPPPPLHAPRPRPPPHGHT